MTMVRVYRTYNPRFITVFVVTHGQPQEEAAIKPLSQIGTKMYRFSKKYQSIEKYILQDRYILKDRYQNVPIFQNVLIPYFV